MPVSPHFRALSVGILPLKLQDLFENIEYGVSFLSIVRRGDTAAEESRGGGRVDTGDYLETHQLLDEEFHSSTCSVR